MGGGVGSQRSSPPARTSQPGAIVFDGRGARASGEAEEPACSLLSLSLSLFPHAWLAAARRQSGPIQTLVSSYTPGEQLSLEVTGNGQLGFLALGATIAMMDLSGGTPVQFDKHPLPFYQPLALRYYHKDAVSGNPRVDYLFVAGGALGVCRITLPASIFIAHPVAAAATDYVDLGIEQPIEGHNFERKRCVDVEVLETASGPVLFALFASSSDQNSPVTPTELRAYTSTSHSSARLAAITFDTTTGPPVQLGTALAVDPADNDSIYVAMGKGGIWRVDLSGSTLTKTQIWNNGSCSLPSSPAIQHVRDVAIVRVATTPPQSVLYAALNYGEVLEITGLGSASQACARTAPTLPCYPERITAVTNQGTDVWLTVVTQMGAGKQEDETAPGTSTECGQASAFRRTPRIPTTRTSKGL